MVEVRRDHHGSVPPLHALFTKRVLFLAGKGGVGKTTLATALALAASRRGKKTLLIEFEGNTRTARLLGLAAQNKDVGDPLPFSPTLFVLSASGQAALEEYLRLVFPVKRLLRTILESRLYQYFVAAAPGLKELLAMGKIWYEERRHDPDTAKPRWDLLVVDMPATGHSLSYLRMPQAARDTFSGTIRREAERIRALLGDPGKSAVNLVTLPEELSVSETLEMYHQLHTDLRLPLGMLFVNRIHRAPLSSAALAQIRINTKARAQEYQLATHVLQQARIEVALTEAQMPYLQQLEAIPLPTLQIPFCFAEEFALPQVEHLSYLLERS